MPGYRLPGQILKPGAGTPETRQVAAAAALPHQQVLLGMAGHLVAMGGHSPYQMRMRIDQRTEHEEGRLRVGLIQQFQHPGEFVFDTVVPQTGPCRPVAVQVPVEPVFDIKAEDVTYYHLITILHILKLNRCRMPARMKPRTGPGSSPLRISSNVRASIVAKNGGSM